MDKSQVTKLANAFSALVRKHLREYLPEINLWNLSNAPDECATHDFCDANELMAQAWCDVYGADPAVCYGDDDDARLWSAAWAAAKANKFRTIK